MLSYIECNLNVFFTHCKLILAIFSDHLGTGNLVEDRKYISYVLCLFFNTVNHLKYFYVLVKILYIFQFIHEFLNSAL